ncbi:hypothetical protein MtrunA17_Chr2g0319031 [Medicago truncatula]|uniref:Uncharacterized protein n=1 Tax=Medicago truncatula TaxID=3880 RepID=A2Q647_MEDTR|nr:hypothetical protein MtrDRAFT_AC172744g5v1 [Medicago truncatula]RHN75242.1 hypothetical protein MtrunA17_Chr2g0319031 [Medicago truncatula]
MWSHDSVGKLDIVISITMWSIWCAGNGKIFYDINTPLMASSKINVIMTRDVIQAFKSMHMEITGIQPQFISWNRGHYGSYIFNVDGSAQTHGCQTRESI